MNLLRYKRMHAPRPTYEIYLEGKLIGWASMTRGGTWAARTSEAPTLSEQGAQSRHEATVGMLGKMTEAGRL